MVRMHIFTLIELLVVISIIAILSAMLLPALGRARDQAQGTRCLNQQKQLFVMLGGYSDECNGAIVFASEKNTTAMWYQLLIRGDYPQRYGMNKETAAVCPTARFAFNYSSGSGYHFAINRNVCIINGTLNRRVSALKKPSQTGYLADSPGSYQFTDAAKVERRHNMGANFLYFDGHVAVRKSLPGAWDDVLYYGGLQ